MNPLDWLKTIYDAFGAKHPALSMLVVVCLGALLAAAVWTIARQQYEKAQTIQHAPPTVPGSLSPQSTGAASTSGDRSPAVTGSGNTVTYGSSGKDQNSAK